jgi:hypothetical protein
MTDNMNSPFPPPTPERVGRALMEMRARRARLRRARTLGTSATIAVVVAVAALVLAGANGSHEVRVVASSSTTEPTTAVITYQPFTATGTIDPSLRVTAELSGPCVAGESNRTYRCFGEGPTAGVYDPCFAGPGGTTQPLVCPSEPTAPEVVQFTAAAPITSEPPVGTMHPWAMQLASGRVCLFASAAWGGLGPYDCHTARTASIPADCRPPVESQPAWTTTCQDDQTATSPFTTTRVVKVWF